MIEFTFSRQDVQDLVNDQLNTSDDKVVFRVVFIPSLNSSNSLGVDVSIALSDGQVGLMNGDPKTGCPQPPGC